MQDKEITDLLSGYRDENLPMFAGSDLNDVNSSGPSGDTPLHLACYRNSYRDAALLLAAGANPNAVGDMSRRPIHEACQFGSTELVSLLVDSGADLECLDEFNCTPLSLAEQRLYSSMVAVLQIVLGKLGK